MKKVVCDIECNGIDNPTEIWCIVCCDPVIGRYEHFIKPSQDDREKERFLDYARSVDLWIGHNWLNYDYPVLRDLLGLSVSDIASKSLDTLILSKLIDYPRQGHSLESYGEEFGYPKGIPLGNELIEAKHIPLSFYQSYSEDLLKYCYRDVEITTKVYQKYKKYLDKEEHRASIDLEHRFQYYIVNSLEDNGFFFNTTKANKLLEEVTKELSILDTEITKVFHKKLRFLKEVTPKETKHGTISRSSIPRKLHHLIPDMVLGAPFSYCEWVEFNPSSHKQLINVLWEAKWQPIDRTQTWIDDERELNKLKHSKHKDEGVDLRIKILQDKLSKSERGSWKINENNLSTLPEDAPLPARYLAKRILLESRRRSLVEWLSLVDSHSRIHGKFYGIGAWTHRMAHQAPNTANIPSEYNIDGTVKPFGKEMRSLWCAPRNRLLVGVDAEGIQLRIFAHYIDDEEFTYALVRGKKAEKSDPHSLNQRILGSVCKSRAAAKRFIYALLLGAGISKLAAILGCSEAEAKQALDNLLGRYTGFALLKETVIPQDAKRGYFIGLDGRKVRIPGEELGLRKHLAMSGYLQNGEAIVMKKAALLWYPQLPEEAKIVNFVHDEWQTECPNDFAIAKQIAEIQADSLRIVGEELKLKCPLAGSYWNDDHKEYTIGRDWYQTH